MATRHRDDKEFFGAVTMTNATLTLPAESVDSDAYVDGSIDAAHLAANSVDSNAYVDESIDPEHIGNRITVVADDTAHAISASDGDVIQITTTGAGTRALTNGSMQEGRIYLIHMIAQSTGTYEMADVDGSVLTFNAAGEKAFIYWDGTALRVAQLNGATLV